MGTSNCRIFKSLSIGVRWMKSCTENSSEMEIIEDVNILFDCVLYRTSIADPCLTILEQL